ncbi:MAG TPA: ABC transporter ATP-binding protein [Thermoleophilaceae bacterium]|nr:ABC transporter ATP-binding protein [Thermoleophilaceae bacterium]
MTATSPNQAERHRRQTSSAPPAVAVDGAGKTFRLPHQRYSTLKERALHPFASRTFDELHALEDVTFEVPEGEFFGIVGRNGSGKSTLLKCLAGIYAVDHGTVEVNGRLSPFIELGVGFNPELSARDNVVINAIMLGLSRKEARARFDEIIEFAELEEFVDLKLKNYSSGMSVRLGFSVAVQVDAEVLLVDEVLAVGDASFQQKCFEQFDRMKAAGRTILYVTHDMASVERFCDRGLVLERGRVVDMGPPEQITRTYSELNFGQAGDADSAGTGGPVKILSAWCEDERGERLVSARPGEQLAACFEVEFVQAVDDPVFTITFRNEVRHTIFVCTTDHIPSGGRFEPGTRTTARFSFENWLAASRYTLTPSVGAPARGHDRYARADDLAALIVQAARSSGGVVELPYEIEVTRA